MPERPPPMPTGENEEAFFMQYVWRRSKREFIDTPTVTFEVDANSIRAHAAPKRGAAPSTPSTGGFRGGYSNSAQYKAGDIVIHTPEGEQAGAYGCALTPPIGTSPETGAPYWMAFPLQSPSVWA